MSVIASDFTSGSKIGPPTETNTALRRMLYWMAKAGGSVSTADLTDPKKIGPPAEDNTILRRLLYWDIAISNNSGGGGASAATQAEVNAGISTNTYVSPNTLVNFNGTFVNPLTAPQINLFGDAFNDIPEIIINMTPGQGSYAIQVSDSGGTTKFWIDANGGVNTSGNVSTFSGDAVFNGFSNFFSIQDLNGNFTVNSTGVLTQASESTFNNVVSFNETVQYPNWSVDATGQITLGTGINFTLATSGSGTKIGVSSNNLLGFWGATPVTRRTVTGSRASGAALASLLTQLDATGVISNSTTA